jgi:dCTP deaminase
MTVLSAQSIRHRCNLEFEDLQFLGIAPWEPVSKQAMGMSYGLTAAGYDIRVGELPADPERTRIVREAMWLHPGEFALIASLERVKIPRDLQVIVHDKSSWARQGLALQNTVLEPGWEGWITLELSNHGKKALRIMRGQPIAQLVFHQLDRATDRPYTGKYQNQGSSPAEAIAAPSVEEVSDEQA